LLRKLWKTAGMSGKDQTNGGIAYLLVNYALRVVYLIPVLLLWRTLMADGVDVGMSLSQMLTYTYLGAVFSDILIVRSPASNWLYEGLIVSLYQRPLGIFPHLAAQTMGRWLPPLLLFSLPMVLLSPLFGVSLQMQSAWAIPSLLLCVSLGFAVDFMFACLTIRLHNASWLVYTIRNAVTFFLAGRVIPFAMLPWGLGRWFQYLPLGSLAGAPLAIYTGLTQAGPLIFAQILWNLILWPTAIVVWRKSQEGMVSFGG
jgi:ABC-2 type transport system permease protein